MNPTPVLAALAFGTTAAAAVALLVPPPRRLAPRVRPYSVVARVALGRPAERAASIDAPLSPALGRLFGPPLRALVGGVGRLVERRSDEQLARLLRQAARTDTPAAFRVHQVGSAIVAGIVAGVAAAVVLHAPTIVLVATVAAFVWGSARPRRTLDRQIEARAARMRQELYTINHLLAMHVRTGAGAIQAVQRIVRRGNGTIAAEFDEVLSATRRGAGEADAFRRAAEFTPEPSAARTYRLLAVGIERGADLGSALLAMSQDLRDARREQLHRDAVRRRAGMLIPTIAILAPIMLLFVAAPLPSIVLGHG